MDIINIILMNQNRTIDMGAATANTHHSAAVIHVLSVFVSVGTEIYTGCDSREGTSFPLTQPAVPTGLLIFHLTEMKGQEKR